MRIRQEEITICGNTRASSNPTYRTRIFDRTSEMDEGDINRRERRTQPGPVSLFDPNEDVFFGRFVRSEDATAWSASYHFSDLNSRCQGVRNDEGDQTAA
jgi:hypothetical protein